MVSDEQAIRDLVATWISASKAGDTETVLGLMDDDVVFLVPGQPLMQGKAAFAAASAAQAQHKSFKLDGISEVVEVKVLGEWAYLWTRLTIVGVPNEGAPPIIRRGNTLSILKKKNCRWLMYRDANLAVVAE